MSTPAPGGRQRGAQPMVYYNEPSAVEWRSLMAQQISHLAQSSAENQQVLQQLVAKASQMVTRPDLEDLLDKKVMSKQESELIHEGFDRRLTEVENRLKAQPAVTRSWLMVALSAGGCGVTVLGIAASALMGLLLFGLEHFVK